MILLCCLFFLEIVVCLTPVVVLPGFGGSNLDVQLTNAHPPSMFCKKNSDPYQIWINVVEDIRYLHIDCLEFILELSWNNKTHQSYDADGVKIIPKDFGGINGCSCLDKNFCEVTHYFYSIFESLKKKGFVPGKNLRAAPYDFRISPQQLINEEKYFIMLQELIEDTFETNNGQKIAIVCHSMGCSLSSVFLGSFVSDSWKNKYIEKWISLSGVFDGSTESFGYMIVGLTPVLPSWLEWKVFGKSLQEYIARLARKTSNWPALQWLIPESTIHPEDIILSTDSKNYTFQEYNQILIDSGFGYIYNIYESVKTLEKRYPDSYGDIDIHCVYAENTPTPTQFYVDNITTPTVGRIMKNVPGDGIVTLEALELCDTLSEKVEVMRLKNSEHQALVGDKRTVKYITDLVS